MRIIGWDVGGAHLKAALWVDGRIERVVQRACPLWQGVDLLHTALRQAMLETGQADRHAATMTGELADIFPSRRAGVAAIVAALVEAVRPAPLLIYSTLGFCAPPAAIDRPGAVASANWHATAALAGRWHPEALVVDVGSTTTDLIPVRGGAPCPAGDTDAARLRSGELVYTGLVRTPLMALAGRAPFAGAWTTLAAELFATTSDVYRLLGQLPDQTDLMPSADGQDKTEAGSRARLARMLGQDAADADEASWRALAAWFAEAQLRQVADAAALVLSRRALPDAAPLLAAGAGRHLVHRLAARLGRPCTDFDNLPVPGNAPRAWLGRCAPAVAVALLAEAAAY